MAATDSNEKYSRLSNEVNKMNIEHEKWRRGCCSTTDNSWMLQNQIPEIGLQKECGQLINARQNGWADVGVVVDWKRRMEDENER